jgi:hypothetical protein
MIRSILVLAAVLLVRDEKSDLLAAAKKAADAKSYTFRGETKLALPEGLDKSGGGEPVKFEGRFERESGLWVKTADFEFVTAGGKTVARPVSEWKQLKDDGGDVQRLLYQALAGSRAPRAPLDDLSAWPRAVAAVKRTEVKETIGDREARVYEVEFSPEFAREMVNTLFPMGRWMDRIPIERPSGSARVWIDGDGRILKLETVAKVAASLQGSQVQLTATRTVTISDYDATKVQVPEEARKVLDSK